jgi:hypothetical protein
MVRLRTKGHGVFFLYILTLYSSPPSHSQFDVSTLQQRYIPYLSCSVFLFATFLFFISYQLLERTLKAASADTTLVPVLWHAIHPLRTPCEQSGVLQQSNFYGLWLASNQIIRRFSVRDKLSFHSDSNENVFVRWW